MHIFSSYLRQNSVVAVGRLSRYSYRHFGKVILKDNHFYDVSNWLLSKLPIEIAFSPSLNPVFA